MDTKTRTWGGMGVGVGDGGGHRGGHSRSNSTNVQPPWECDLFSPTVSSPVAVAANNYHLDTSPQQQKQPQPQPQYNPHLSKTSSSSSSIRGEEEYGGGGGGGGGSGSYLDGSALPPSPLEKLYRRTASFSNNSRSHSASLAKKYQQQQQHHDDSTSSPTPFHNHHQQQLFHGGRNSYMFSGGIQVEGGPWRRQFLSGPLPSPEQQHSADSALFAFRRPTSLSGPLPFSSSSSCQNPYYDQFPGGTEIMTTSTPQSPWWSDEFHFRNGASTTTTATTSNGGEGGDGGISSNPYLNPFSPNGSSSSTSASPNSLSRPPSSQQRLHQHHYHHPIAHSNGNSGGIESSPSSTTSIPPSPSTTSSLSPVSNGYNNIIGSSANNYDATTAAAPPSRREGGPPVRQLYGCYSNGGGGGGASSSDPFGDGGPPLSQTTTTARTPSLSPPAPLADSSTSPSAAATGAQEHWASFPPVDGVVHNSNDHSSCVVDGGKLPFVAASSSDRELSQRTSRSLFLSGGSSSASTSSASTAVNFSNGRGGATNYSSVGAAAGADQNGGVGGQARANSSLIRSRSVHNGAFQSNSGIGIGSGSGRLGGGGILPFNPRGTLNRSVSCTGAEEMARKYAKGRGGLGEGVLETLVAQLVFAKEKPNMLADMIFCPTKLSSGTTSQMRDDSHSRGPFAHSRHLVERILLAQVHALVPAFKEVAQKSGAEFESSSSSPSPSSSSVSSVWGLSSGPIISTGEETAPKKRFPNEGYRLLRLQTQFVDAGLEIFDMLCGVRKQFPSLVAAVDDQKPGRGEGVGGGDRNAGPGPGPGPGGLRIACFGGGPGSEAIAIRLFFMKLFPTQLQMQVDIFDRMKKWEEMVDSISLKGVGLLAADLRDVVCHPTGLRSYGVLVLLNSLQGLGIMHQGQGQGQEQRAGNNNSYNSVRRIQTWAEFWSTLYRNTSQGVLVIILEKNSGSAWEEMRPQRGSNWWFSALSGQQDVHVARKL